MGGAGSGAADRRSQDREGAQPARCAAAMAAYLQPHTWSLVAVLALAFVSTGLALLGPFLLGGAIDVLIVHKSFAAIPRTALLLLAVYAAGWAAGLGESLIMQIVSKKALRVLRRQLFDHVRPSPRPPSTAGLTTN